LFIAPFVATPLPVVRQMLTVADLRPGETFYDLGSGDGRTVVMATQEFGARSVGVELREDLAKKALATVHELGIQDRVTIVQEDVFKIDLNPANLLVQEMSENSHSLRLSFSLLFYKALSGCRPIRMPVKNSRID